MIDFAAEFASALTYEAFLETHGSTEDRRRWEESLARSVLAREQTERLQGFERQMHVLCLAGAWCGDCAYQCPVFKCFAQASPRIALRFADRDANPTLARELRLCGGARVPVVVLLSEDDQECARYGDRTLSQYRAMAAQAIGPAAGSITSVVNDDLRSHVIADWLREFERVQWMLRLSLRLRKKHGD